MVLKKCLFILNFIFNIFFCFGTDDYWQKIFTTAFSNSPKICEIKNEYVSSFVYKKQNDYLWFPYFQLDLQQNLQETRGDYLYVQNQYTDNQNMWIANPILRFSINQKLPGNGNLNLATSYGFNYLINRNVYLQKPQIQFSYSQSLGYGTFKIVKNPEKLLLNEQLSYSQLQYKKELLQQIHEIIEIIQNYDNLRAEEKYYTSLVAQYESEFKTAQAKYDRGLQSNLETYYAQHQKTTCSKQLKDILFEKKELYKEIKLLLPDFDEVDLENNYFSLKQQISALYNSIIITEIENNIDSRLYTNILNQQKYNYQITENNFVPILYINSSVSPDPNFYVYYGDWHKSFRNLIEFPYPLSFSTSIGIKINFESIKAKKLRKELLKLDNENIQKNFQTNLERQNKELILLQNQISQINEYLNNLDKEINIEKSFREKRLKLYQEGVITQNEFTESETLFFIINKDYVSNFWKSILNQIEFISLTSQSEQLISTLIGADYEIFF
ncbi:MAG: TolC family protein [Clostridia bacterium]|nr:TolC family protein [Clostridia bacterium]